MIFIKDDFYHKVIEEKYNASKFPFLKFKA